MRNNAILNSYFSSFRMASFRYFVFSPGVISFFRNFAWRFSLFRLFAWRYFVFSPRQNAKRKDEKTKKRHAKRRNNEKTPREKTKERNNEMAQTSHHTLPILTGNIEPGQHRESIGKVQHNSRIESSLGCT